MEEKSSSDYAFWAGLCGAFFFFTITPLWATARSLMVIIHELGHTIFAWLFAYPAIPALDFRYGGGMAYFQGRSDFILLCVYLLLACAVYNLRKHEKAFYVGCGCLLLYALLAHTQWHMLIILFMGHGFELTLAGVFLYRALAGSSIVHQSERPIYCGLSFFIILNSLWFAYSIIAIPAARHRYLLGKGGHLNDFHRMAKMLDVSLSTVAGFFLLTCFLPLLINYLLKIKRDSEQEDAELLG